MWNAVFGFKRMESYARVLALFLPEHLPDAEDLTIIKSDNPEFDQYSVTQVEV